MSKELVAKNKRSRKKKTQSQIRCNVIAMWGGHRFVVSPIEFTSFRDLKIKGSSETEDKTQSSQQYVTRKNGKPMEVSFTVDLNALAGFNGVYMEAMQYVQEADDGKTDYLYLSGKKALDCKIMLVSAEVDSIVTMPGRGDIWVACSVKLTFKKAGIRENGGGDGQDPNGNGSAGYYVRVYYSFGSGAVQSVSGWDASSIENARKKAWAKVPKNASWASENYNKVGGKDGKGKNNYGSKDQPNLKTLDKKKKDAEKASKDKNPKAGLEKQKELVDELIK